MATPSAGQSVSRSVDRTVGCHSDRRNDTLVNASKSQCNSYFGVDVAYTAGVSQAGGQYGQLII